MGDELIEDTCEICKRVVKNHMWESGYGGGSYNRNTILPHEERRINVPERQYGFNVLVCQDCIDKEPSLHSVILKQRKEWFDKEIKMTKSKVKNNRNNIQRLKNEIPVLWKEVKELRSKRKELK